LSGSIAGAYRPRERGTARSQNALRVVHGAKVCVPRVYPIYDAQYGVAVEVVRRYLERFET